MNSYKKNKGNAGLEGVQFQLDLLILSFLNALRNFKNWRVSTEDKEAGKYDDIVIKLSDEAAVLIQAKHKANKNVTKEQLLSTNSKNSDFSLPKYFFSHLEVKEKFKEKTLIICTNTGIDQRGLEVLTNHIVDSNHILFYKGRNQSFFTFNDDILTDLKASAEVYLDKNLQDRGIDKAVISDDNLKNFLKNLQIFSYYPCKSELHKIIEGLLSHLADFCLCRTISYHEIYRKVEAWFKQPRGEYLTETRAKAMFCEIKSDKYCELLKDYQVSFENNHFNFKSSNRVFHVTGEGRYLMQMLKIYCTLKGDKSRKLYVNPDDGTEVQKQVVEAFGLRRYTFLIIIGASFMEESGVSDKLRNILEKDPYKKLVLVADDRSTITELIGLKDVLQVDGSLTFADISKESQQKLLNNTNILFQDKTVNLGEFLHTQVSEDYAKSLNSVMVEKLIKGERIKVGAHPLNSDEEATCYYINRTFERKINRRGQLKYSFPEANIYEVNDKLILISDCAGMGKSMFLTRLALTAKEKTPHIWVIKIILNDYTRILRDSLRKNKQTLNLTELLNSQEATKLKNDFERFVFSINRKILLLVDGVDEISPDYTELVTSLLEQCQKSLNIVKIFVTTRPHLSQDLEERLKVESIKILPFTRRNQIDFLASYWTHNLQLNDTSKDKCQHYAQTLITKMFSWIKSRYYKENPFTAIPLQVRILAEIFQENVRSKDLADWGGCKEYLNGNESEPKLPEKINIARLYDMFIDRKQDVFVDKGNPGGNPAANRALINQFEDCLAYHRSLALQEILSEGKHDFFLCRHLDCKDMEEYVLKIGIVQKSDDEFQFIHRTFAEYFVAGSITRELQLQNKNVEFQKFLIDKVLVTSEFKIVRTFLDSFLQKNIDSLPCTVFESYQYLVTYENCGKNILFSLAAEGLVAILQLILKSVQFGIVAGKKLIVTDSQNEYRKKSNTLNDLQILVHKTGVNIKNEYGTTPLHSAVWGNHLDMINFLVKHGADVNSTNSNGQTALHLVGQMGQLETAKLLVGLGVNVNIINNKGHTAAYTAARSWNWTIVNYLVECGTDVNIRDYRNYTILHLVAKWGRLDIIKSLVIHGVDINVRDADGNTALHLAANERNWVTVRYLAECGININLRDSKGRTPLHLAAELGDLETIKCFVKYGADVNMKNNDGNTALHIATLNSEFETAIYLLEQGADINIKGDEGRTALHLAVFMGTLNTTKYLVEHGANLSVKDNVGNTALHLAAFRGRLDTVRYLIECGLEVNVTDSYGSTALHLAAIDGNLSNIEYLVERGLGVNARDKNGSTVLHLAAFKGRLDNIRYLVECGADVGIRDNNGQTALDVAASNEHFDCVSYLEEVG